MRSSSFFFVFLAFLIFDRLSRTAVSHVIVAGGAVSHVIVAAGAVSHVIVEDGAVSHVIVAGGAVSHVIVEDCSARITLYSWQLHLASHPRLKKRLADTTAKRKKNPSFLSRMHFLASTISFIN